MFEGGGGWLESACCAALLLETQSVTRRSPTAAAFSLTWEILF
jgi:hypothetical protein